MNWLQKIKDILGKFWTVVFSERNFTLGVENLEAVLAAHQQMLHDKWVMGHMMADRTSFRDRIPFVVYLLKSELVTDATGTHMRSCVNPPADWGSPDGGWLDSTNVGDTDLTATVSNGSWAVRSRFDVPLPHHMADHVVDYTRTLFRGADYDWRDGGFLFYFNPADLHLPEEAVTDADGVLRVYWKIFGWADSELAVKDAVAAIYDERLNKWADTVWDMHQNGATEYNTKKLLAGVAGAVVADNSGAVDKTWAEQNISCMMVGDKAYYAPSGVSANVSAGENVNAGTVLFGGLMFLSGEEIGSSAPPSEYIPGIPVMTDIGRLTAYNSDTYDGRAYANLALTSGKQLIGEIGEGIASSTAASAPIFEYVYDDALVSAYKWVNSSAGVRYTPTRHPTLTVTGTNRMYADPELTGNGTRISQHPQWIILKDDPDKRKYLYNSSSRQNTSSPYRYRWRWYDSSTSAYTYIWTAPRWPSPAYVVPLKSEYDASVPSEYADMCIFREGARQYETVPVSDPMNPMQFVLGNMRRARSELAVLTMSSACPELAPALRCIRRNVDAGSIVTVYLQAYGDTVDTTATFTATAGNAAVATAATITVQDMFAEAEAVL